MQIPANVKVLIDDKALSARIGQLGEEITRDYAGKPLILLGCLKGSFMFMADLSRRIDLPLRMDFLGLRSYEGAESTGVVQITSDLTRPIQDADVLIVEDIVDTGLTMRYLLDNLLTRHPRSVRICSLLHKPARTRAKIAIDYLGFTIEDHFVVGYGLDYEEVYRNLPVIGILDPSHPVTHPAGR